MLSVSGAARPSRAKWRPDTPRAESRQGQLVGCKARARSLARTLKLASWFGRRREESFEQIVGQLRSSQRVARSGLGTTTKSFGFRAGEQRWTPSGHIVAFVVFVWPKPVARAFGLFGGQQHSRCCRSGLRAPKRRVERERAQTGLQLEGEPAKPFRFRSGKT